MFEDYLASKEDLDAVGEALSYVWRPGMKFAFGETRRIENTLVISYDSRNIFLWFRKKIGEVKPLRKESEYFLYRIPHKLRIKDELQLGWRAGTWGSQIEEALPKELATKDSFELPRISGGLLTPFLSLQRKKKAKGNPYTLYEGYLATIIHEFAHVYWDSFKAWWPSDKKLNLSYLTIARRLYQNRVKRVKVSLKFPLNRAFSEVFAFCSEYYASNIFWPKYRRILDSFAEKRIETLIGLERKHDLLREDSVLEPSKSPHDFAFVVGKIILSKYTRNWPVVLTDSQRLSSTL